MRLRLIAARRAQVAPTHFVLLPAAYAGPDDFLREGFIDAAHDRGLPVDFTLVDLDLAHVTDRTVLGRLRQQIILPARAQGCENLWLCGISLGGFISLAYAERHPSEIDGLCLLAPYLGNRMVSGEIRRAGGLAAWESGKLAADDDERRIWRFVKMCPPRMHLGFGSADRFADSHRMMARALPRAAVREIQGGHDWPVWRQLWENFLDFDWGPVSRAAATPPA